MPTTPSRTQRRLLEKVFTTALDRGFRPERAETYGVWILCFARYCKAHGIDPPAAAQVPNFMAYLVGRADLTAAEREHALDAVLFALTEVPNAFESGVPPERTLPPHAGASVSGYDPNAETTPGGRALTHLLLETDVGLYDAVRLSIGDVDREAGVLHVGEGDAARRVPMPDRLRSDLGHAARQALARGSTHLFPDAYAKYVADDASASGNGTPDASAPTEAESSEPQPVPAKSEPSPSTPSAPGASSPADASASGGAAPAADASASTDSSPADSSPAESSPAESSPAESSPAESSPAESDSPETGSSSGASLFDTPFADEFSNDAPDSTSAASAEDPSDAPPSDASPSPDESADSDDDPSRASIFPGE